MCRKSFLHIWTFICALCNGLSQIMGHQWNSWTCCCDERILAIAAFSSSRKIEIFACIHPSLQKTLFQRIVNMERSYKEGKRNIFMENLSFEVSSQALYLAYDFCHICQLMNIICEAYLWHIPPPIHLLIPLIDRHFHIFLFHFPSFKLFSLHIFSNTLASVRDNLQRKFDHPKNFWGVCDSVGIFFAFVNLWALIFLSIFSWGAYSNTRIQWI